MDTVARFTAHSESIKGGWRKPNEVRAKEGLAPVAGGDTPYMQQQNYSLAALEKRDAQPDPFGKTLAAPAAPTPDDVKEAAKAASVAIFDQVVDALNSQAAELARAARDLAAQEAKLKESCEAFDLRLAEDSKRRTADDATIIAKVEAQTMAMEAARAEVEKLVQRATDEAAQLNLAAEKETAPEAEDGRRIAAMFHTVIQGLDAHEFV